MRYTRKQKLAIAKYQHQRYRYRDMWGNITKTVYLCKMCRGGKEYDLDDLEVDHIIPASIGGPETLDNLQLLCPKHNKRKGTAIRIKGKLIRINPRTVKKKGSTTKRKPRAVKKKASTAKRKTSAAGGRRRTTRTKSSRATERSRTVKKARR